jgi:hypothetical protein
MDKKFKVKVKTALVSNLKRTKKTKILIYSFTKLFLECGLELDFLQKS